MKKFLIFLLVAVMLLFAGCEKSGAPKKDKEEAPVVPASYSADLKMKYKNTAVEGKYIQKSIMENEFKFTYPKSMSGVSLKCNGTKFTFSYAGIDLSTDLSKLPESSAGKMLMESFLSAAQNTNITKEKSGDKWIYSGENSGHEFTVVQDAKTGFFETFSMPEYHISAELTNFVVE